MSETPFDAMPLLPRLEYVSYDWLAGRDLHRLWKLDLYTRWQASSWQVNLVLHC